MSEPDVDPDALAIAQSAHAVKLNLLLRTTEYRGDHSADIAIAHEVEPGETVEQLAERLLGRASRADFLEIRIVSERAEPRS